LLYLEIKYKANYNRKTIAYARVLSHKQKDVLERQKQILEIYCASNKLIDRDYLASINLHNQLQRVHREVTPIESKTSQLVLNAQENWQMALNLSARLTDLTSIVEAGIKHHL